MTTGKLEQAARQALGALVRAEAMYGQPNADIQTALREALAEQAEQEPVAIIEKEAGFETEVYATGHADSLPDGVFKLYATPARTKDLTDDEIEDVCCRLWSGGWRKKAMNDFARAVIAKFKEKNNANNNS